MRDIKSDQRIHILADYPHPIALRKTLGDNVRLRFIFSPARVAELVDAGDSKSPAARCAGSSPASGTITTRASYARIILPGSLSQTRVVRLRSIQHFQERLVLTTGNHKQSLIDQGVLGRKSSAVDAKMIK